MNFGCHKCNRSFNELQLWGRLKNEDYRWICTSCNNALRRNFNEKRKMSFGCRCCNHTFEELKSWGWLEFCGDHWRCLQCKHDLIRDPETVFKESMQMAILLGKDLFGQKID